MPSSGHAGQAIARRSHARHTQLYAPLLPLPSPRSPSPARRLPPAQRGTLARGAFRTSAICTTLYFLSYIHTATAVPPASLTSASVPAACSEYHARWRRARAGQGTGCHPGTFFARKMWAIRPRAWAWGVARAGDTLLLALSAGAGSQCWCRYRCWRRCCDFRSARLRLLDCASDAEGVSCVVFCCVRCFFALRGAALRC